MPEPDLNALNNMQRLLLMAAAVLNLRPGTLIRANCARLLRQALLWAGLFDDEVREALRADEHHPVIDRTYATLIAMIRHQPAREALFEGAGNLDTPAWPQYTGCRLTPLGKRVADLLLEQYPQYRNLT